MDLHVIYRACDGERLEIRPKFFSKLICLKSILKALQCLEHVSFHLIYDGVLREDFRKLVEPIGEIDVLSNVGNSQSFWFAYQKAVAFPSDHFVYFLEDDYLHCANAIQKLFECFTDVPADYVSLYDHPVRYKLYDGVEKDWQLEEDTIYISKSHHWRTVESTCMTFATRSHILREDQMIFERYVYNTIKPADRELFRHLQGLGSYAQQSNKRRLVSPIPSLATHCHIPWLAPTVNWQILINEVE